MIWKSVLFRPESLYEALFRQKLLGSGSETVVGTDYTPYLYRSAPSFGQPYNRQRPVVVGGSVGWNQLVDVGATSVTVQSGHKYYANINGSKTIGSSNGSAITINDGSADNVADLTALWGSSVADAIYAMERATAGSGVAYFKSLFGEDYYTYDSGSLQSVQTSGHVIRDANDTVIGNYALDPNLVLRGVPKLDANGKLYYDGDIYHPNGTVERKYGIVDLGTLNWVYDGDEIFRDSIYVAKFKGLGICSKYQVIQVASWTQIGDKQMSFTNSQDNPILRIRDSSMGTDATAFKEAVSGIYLVYELATPTTESATPYTALQMADPQGTEEWVDSRAVKIPVGQITDYIQK